MFKLLRLAIYAIVGYAAYHSITDVVNSSGEGEGSQRGGGRRGAGQGRGARSGGGAARMSGGKRGGGGGKGGGPAGPRGKAEVTADTDGGSTRHRVGRGVV